MKNLFILAAMCFIVNAAHGDITVIDDAGNGIRLAKPARRIVSLAPHVTEILFAAGAGSLIVGAVEYSDYPPEAKKIPRVGDNRAADLERIAALNPEIVIAWFHGNAKKQLDQLRKLQIPVYYSEPRKIEDVATDIERMGQLAGTQVVASKAAGEFRAKYEELKRRYGTRPAVTVFYEIWNKPLYTVNGQHLISDVIRLCGGVNIFAALPDLAPVVTFEAVVKLDPQAVIATGMGGVRPEWLNEWRRWPELKSVKNSNLFVIDSDIMNRHGPRIVDGARDLCAAIDKARQQIR